jgi:hypothetical protein
MALAPFAKTSVAASARKVAGDVAWRSSAKVLRRNGSSRQRRSSTPRSTTRALTKCTTSTHGEHLDRTDPAGADAIRD